MSLYVTYCSKEKSDEEGLIPAVDRYQSSRIEKIYERSIEEDEKFAILSGKYGLIEPETEIPEYDQLLELENLDEVSRDVQGYLEKNQVSEVVYFTRPLNEIRRRYHKCIEQACKAEDIKFTKKILKD